MAVQTGSTRFKLFNDEPTLADCGDRTGMVRKIGDAIAGCDPPHVFGIHGEWGCGKTSFLYQLQLYLTGRCPQPLDEDGCTSRARKLWGGKWKPRAHVTSVWFEAWRYQNENAPIVALLQEIRTQLSWQLTWANKVAKIGEVAIRGALLSLEDLTKKIGIQASKIQETGEKWERDHLAYALPSQMIREHLNSVLKQLLGDKGHGKQRLVVLIDDLDRCEGLAAYNLLEGMKIYLNLPKCVFVLGMNQEIVESAIRSQLPEQQGAADRARVYLDKLCQNMDHVPLVQNCPQFLHGLLIDAGLQNDIADEVRDVLAQFPCLPANFRRLKKFANTVLWFCDHMQDREQQQQWSWITARTLVIMASLYLFHHALYRMVEADRDFYFLIKRWAQGHKVKHELLDGLKLPLSTRTTDAGETSAVLEPELEKAYWDPADDTVFRIQPLVIDESGSGVDDLISDFILR